MQNEEYLEAVARESAALADAAERAGLDAAVPSCPGWTVADVVEHVGNVQRWATRIVETRPTERISRPDMSESPAPEELLGWFRAASRALVEALGAADPAAPVWTFIPGGTTRFWFRRQAHEVAVHRVDAELAGGTAAPIATALAADGIAEWLDVVSVFGADALTRSRRDRSLPLHRHRRGRGGRVADHPDRRRARHRAGARQGRRRSAWARPPTSSCFSGVGRTPVRSRCSATLRCSSAVAAAGNF